MKYWILILSLLTFSLQLDGQTDSTQFDFGDFGGIVYLDSLVVSASRTGFDVQDFIRRVRADESFLDAFDNLRKLSYQSTNQFTFYNKKNKQKATYYGLIDQTSDGDCRTMKIVEENDSGNFYKRKKKIRYYTASMHQKLFYTEGKICESQVLQDPNPKGMDKHIQELRKLIFDPGDEVDVPLIGKKLAIFSPEMQPYYDYAVRSELYNNTVDCYVFVVNVKDEFQDRKESKTVIKHLKTYFNKANFQVMARDYELAYRGMLFDFDVKMMVELDKYQQFYVPTKINYKGWWDIPARKPEIGEFELGFYGFEFNGGEK